MVTIFVLSGVIVFRAAFNAGNYLASLPIRADYETDAAFEAAEALAKDNNALYTSVLSSVLNALAIMFLGFVSITYIVKVIQGEW